MIVAMTAVVIVGGGPGGYEAALVAAQMGAEVTLVDSDGIGGSAVLTDCVPSKTLVATADVMVEVADSPELGVRAAGQSGGVGVDLAAVADAVGVAVADDDRGGGFAAVLGAEEGDSSQVGAIGFTYADGAVGLQDVSFAVPAGELVVVVGANGSGKTTLVNLLESPNMVLRNKSTEALVFTAPGVVLP